MTDARGLETSITDYAGGTTAGIQRTYEYDWEGNVTKEKELEGNYKTYTYDSKGRNTVVKYHKADGTETLKTAYTYDVNDQVTLMEDYEKKNGSWELYRSTKYTYDALKRMSSYTEWDGEGAAPAEPTVSYTYDIEGNVTAVDYASTGSELTGLTFEYDSSRKLTKIKAKTGGLLSDTVREYSYDDQGRVSTTSLTAADGSAAATYEYDDFGGTTVTSGADLDNEICYTGQIYDQSSGLYYYNARFYDPENARFLTQDTYRGEATQPDTLHLYAYCANNPINYVDPTGHFKKHWWNKVSTVGGAVDAILVLVGLGGAKGLTGKALSQFVKKNKKKIIKKFKKIVKKAISNKKARKVLIGKGSVVVNAMLAFVGESFGGLFAKAIDWVDPKIRKKYRRSNGWILN